MRTAVLLSALSLLPAAALAQEGQTVPADGVPTPRQPVFGVRTGLSYGDREGVFVGLSLKGWGPPVRLDADAWSAFEDFGRRSAGLAVTANYMIPAKGYYLGVGVGYARAVERHDPFDSVATKYIVGARLPGTSAYIEGAALWAQHAIGSGHLIGTVSLVFRL